MDQRRHDELSRAGYDASGASSAWSWALLGNASRAASQLMMVRTTRIVVVSATDCQRCGSSKNAVAERRVGRVFMLVRSRACGRGALHEDQLPDSDAAVEFRFQPWLRSPRRTG